MAINILIPPTNGTLLVCILRSFGLSTNPILTVKGVNNLIATAQLIAEINNGKKSIFIPN
jgi:hypothetical protein